MPLGLLIRHPEFAVDYAVVRVHVLPAVLPDRFHDSPQMTVWIYSIFRATMGRSGPRNGERHVHEYRAPGEDPGISELKIGIGDLYRRDPWELHVYPDYAAPIAYASGDGLGVVKAVFGFWPKFMQPERLDEKGKKKRKLDTMNARTESVGESRLYGKAWREGQRCLISAQWIYEPCYETGKNVWH